MLTKTMKINEILNKLCEEHYGTQPYVADGIFFHSNVDGWEDEKNRVLFVLKQPNSDDLLGEDYREYDIDTLMTNQVWQQLLTRLYGIHNTTASYYPSYEEACSDTLRRETFARYPFAAININKENGAGTTSTADMNRYAKENLAFISQQIAILQPRYVICCGVGVFDIMNAAITPSIESSGNWLKYNPNRDIIFFDTYHPGKPMAGDRLKEAYEMPLKELEKLLK